MTLDTFFSQYFPPTDTGFPTKPKTSSGERSPSARKALRVASGAIMVLFESIASVGSPERAPGDERVDRDAREPLKDLLYMYTANFSSSNFMLTNILYRNGTRAGRFLGAVTACIQGHTMHRHRSQRGRVMGRVCRCGDSRGATSLTPGHVTGAARAVVAAARLARALGHCCKGPYAGRHEAAG